MSKQFYLTRTNSAGYESVWCNDSDWHGLELSKFPGQWQISRTPTIKVWKTRAGALRWLAERPGMSDYATVTERA